MLGKITRRDCMSKKEEILEKSRQARMDEGVEYAELKGHRLAAWVAFVVAGVPIIIYSTLFGQTIIVVALTTFIEAYYAVLHAEAYRHSKQPKHIFLAAICAAAFIFCAFIFVRLAMGLPGLPGFGG
jgi:hypothetical protein